MLPSSVVTVTYNIQELLVAWLLLRLQLYCRAAATECVVLLKVRQGMVFFLSC